MAITKDIENKISIDNKLGKSVIKNVSSPVVYSGGDYGLDSTLNGKGVKIAVLDSGTPRHKDITVQGAKASFCENEKTIYDQMGHATLVSGIIGAKNRNTITGIAPNAELSFAKIMDKTGYCSFNSLVAGLLWAIAKEVDIIVMSLGTQYEYPILKDAIQKASEEHICVFAAAGNKTQDTGAKIDIPARYAEVFSVGSLTKGDKTNRTISERVDFSLKNTMLLTTYLENKYIRTSGSSVLTSLVAGLAALLIEKHKKTTKKEDIKELVYKNLMKLL